MMANVLKLFHIHCKFIIVAFCLVFSTFAQVTADVTADDDKLVSLTMSCPAVCSCEYSLRLIDCSYRSLTKLPQHVDRNLTTLNLAGNRITHLTVSYFEGMLILTQLNLSANLLSYLPDNVFVGLKALKTLDLSHNRFNQVSVSAVFMQLPSLKWLSLAGNLISEIGLSDDHVQFRNMLALDLSDNSISQLSLGLLNILPNLAELRLGGNHLNIVSMESFAHIMHPLTHLDLSGNAITRLTAVTPIFQYLKFLNVSGNHLAAIDPAWFTAFPRIESIDLNGNLFDAIAAGSFSTARQLRKLSLSYMTKLIHVEKGSLRGLSSLENLQMHDNPSFSRIHYQAFADLWQLQQLDLRNNHLQSISYWLFGNLTKLQNASLSGNHWYCDCRMRLLQGALIHDGRGIGSDIVCSAPPVVEGVKLYSVIFNQSLCTDDRQNKPTVVTVPFGHETVLDCDLTSPAAEKLTWYIDDDKVIEGILNENQSNMTGMRYGYVQTNSSLDEEESKHVKLLNNGSLMIFGVTRRDAGYYYCTVSDRRGNYTTAIEIRLDYSVMATIIQMSFIVGFMSAATFFSFAALLGLIRYLAYVCSDDERAKRRSLRELLAEIRNGSHMDRLSAYRSAKMDQLAAFKSATMDQLSSFKSHRVGRLRKYKQATVTAVLHQLEKMREHYAAQTARIKESYALNVERLRESYALQRARFQDRRSISVQHIRKQYRARAERAREYSAAQVARLREQYKQQQQYFLKVLELIDVGSCVSQAVEVECMKAESAIFDAGVITFDEEARPSHATRGEESLLFDTASLPDGFPVHLDSSPSLSDADAMADNDSGDYLPPLDIRMRSFSSSNVGEGRVVLQPGNVQVHRACEIEMDTAVVWKKSESTPVICVVQEPEDPTVTDTLL